MQSRPPNKRFKRPTTRLVLETTRSRCTARRRSPARMVPLARCRRRQRNGSGKTPRTRPPGERSPSFGQPAAAVDKSVAWATESPKRSLIPLTNAAADKGVAASSRLLPGGASAAKSCAGSPGSPRTFCASTPGFPTCADPFAAVSISDIEGSSSSSDTHDIMSSESESDLRDTMSSLSCTDGEGSGVRASNASNAAPPAVASGARGVRTAASSSPTISAGS